MVIQILNLRRKQMFGMDRSSVSHYLLTSIIECVNLSQDQNIKKEQNLPYKTKEILLVARLGLV